MGVNLQPEGSWGVTIKTCRSKLRTQVGALIRKSISADGAWIICNSVLKPQILYPMMLASAHDCDLGEMEKEARRLFLRNAKLPITTPLDLLGAHEHLSGVGWLPWADEMNIQRVCTILQVMNTPDIVTGKLVELMLPYLARVSCRSGNPFELSPSLGRVDHLLWDVWKWLSKHSVGIACSDSDLSWRFGLTILEAAEQLCTDVNTLREVEDGCKQYDCVGLWEIVRADSDVLQDWLFKRTLLVPEQRWISLLKDILTQDGRRLRKEIIELRHQIIPGRWARAGTAVTVVPMCDWIAVILRVKGDMVSARKYKRRGG